MWTTSLAHHDIHQEGINASHLRSPRGVGACTVHSIFLILSRALTLTVSAAAAAADDDDGGGGGDDDDDDIHQEDINASHLRSPRGVGACTVHSIFLILSRAPVNRGLPSIVGADKAHWHTPRPIVRARWILVLWPPGLEGRLVHL